MHKLAQAARNSFFQAFVDAKHTVDGTFIRDGLIWVKDLIKPWNRIKLRRMDRSWQETDTRMEEALCELLCDFFDGQQPFHAMTGTKYDTRATLEDDPQIHYDLWNELYGHHAVQEYLQHRRSDDPESQHDLEHFMHTLEHSAPIYRELLDIMIWYREGGLDYRGEDAFMKVISSVGLDKALLEQTRVEQEITDKMVFIVKHRNMLWT